MSQETPDIQDSFLDNVLVAVAYYIGEEKEYDGVLPFIILASTTMASMLFSEVFAKMKQRKRKIGPAPVQSNKVKLIISNFIPFTTLNLIFATGIFISIVIRIIQRTQKGAPNMSIQCVIMLLCLLFSNSEAKQHFRRYLAVRLGKEVPFQITSSQAPTRDCPV